jgi:Undecaprenyl-phosphate glucose phosphotransferase
MFRAVTLTSSRPAAPARRLVNRPRKERILVRAALSVAAAGLDALAILATALAAGLLQLHAVPVRADPTPADVVSGFLHLGGLTALLFLVTAFALGDYTLAKCLTPRGLLRRTLIAWSLAVVSAFAMAFAFHVGNALTTIALFGFSTSGLAATCLVRFGFLKAAEPHVTSGDTAGRRMFLIGFENEIEAFTQRYEHHLAHTHVMAAIVLRGNDSLDEDLTLACASARILQPDDVFILVPWSQNDTIDACVDAFQRLPAAIHLGPDGSLERFADAEIAKVGPIASLNLVRRPLTRWEIATKRGIDLVLALGGLVLLAPLFLMVAIAIKIDSPGPVIFRQRRYGFNQRPFRIFKFRSMRTLEDSSKLVQVVEGDVRVTRFGNFMRRHNIDELPQLLNVVLGNMSLVGPRPHALAHDQAFERSIAFYARRHNVKPGITGWAQVNGLRGGFCKERMQARVEHDLYYIDNWSLRLDIKILWLTIASKQSYKNAF